MGQLSLDQEKVLAAATLNARDAITTTAKVAGLSQAKARYILSRLQSLGVITPMPLINIHALGYTDFCLFLRFEPGKAASRANLMKFLLGSHYSAWVAELAGEYSLSVSLFAKNISEVDQFLLSCAKALGGGIVQKSFAIRARWAIFQYKSPKVLPQTPETLTRSSSVEVHEVEHMDTAILSRLSRFPAESSSTASRALQMPLTTYSYRLRQLEKKGIIGGYTYLVNPNKTQRHSYRILVYGRSIDLSLRQDLFHYARAHPYISAFVHCVGDWDYELNVEVPDPPLLSEITAELEEMFGGRIQALKTMTVLETKKSLLFPFA